MPDGHGPCIAYFSMEIALEPGMPTYAGGLGVLAGDTLRSAADLGVCMVGVTLLHREGYFRQILGPDGSQQERPDPWQPHDWLDPLEERVVVEIEGQPVTVCAWRYGMRGQHGHEVPVYLLDTDLPENRPEDRHLNQRLYGGDLAARLRQEVVLGIGGVRLLEALGYDHIDRFHMNEGHAALAALALGERHRNGDGDPSVEAVRRRCVFTTHTPVPAGHDQFPRAMARRMLGESAMKSLDALGEHGDLNMTELALRASRFVNGVAMRHGEVSQDMFPHYPIRSITNGVHPATWASPPFAELFDRHIRHWRADPQSLRYAVGIPLEEVAEAHRRAKRLLLETVSRQSATTFDPSALTLGFARRSTAYKRAALVFRDPERLALLAKERGPLQLVFAGKAHPRDEEGKELIRRIFRAAEQLQGRVSVAYLPDYDMGLGRILCAGCDVWLNTPVPPLEASGTSGMKAALNGVPSLSVLDGWWVEGCVEGVTGWAIGEDGPAAGPGDELDARHAAALYDKLEGAVMPCFYERPERFREIQRFAISLNASFFNTHRMVLQYLYDAYRDPGTEPEQELPPGAR